MTKDEILIESLVKVLLTTDGKGAKAKEDALEELLIISYNKGYNDALDVFEQGTRLNYTAALFRSHR